MWAGAVSEEDRLDREQTKWVMRRAARLGRPQRRVALAGLGFVAISALATVLGPVFVRYGIDHGISAGNTRVLNIAVGGFSKCITS